MNRKSLWDYVPPPGPVWSLALIGLLLLSGLLYYRSVKIQRFLEPALVMSQPRSEFSDSIYQLFQKEFGVKPVRGIKVRMSSIVIKKSVLFSNDGTLTPDGKIVLRRLARVFLPLFQNDSTRPYISVIMINARFAAAGIQNASAVERMKAARMVGAIQDTLFGAEPEIGRKYGNFFVASEQAVTLEDTAATDLIELRIIPSELLHIEVLQKLLKYTY